MEKCFINEEIKIIYKVSKGDNVVKIFGKNFVKNNINNCVLIYENKELKLQEKIKIDKNIDNLQEIEIILRITNQLTNISYMFSDCSSLVKIINIDEIDTSLVNDISFMFHLCRCLEFLPDIGKWDISSVTNIKFFIL